MNTLYVVTLSSGTPRQRVYRSNYQVYASGPTPAAAGRAALAYLESSMKGGHIARVEGTKALCATPDAVVRPYYL